MRQKEDRKTCACLELRKPTGANLRQGDYDRQPAGQGALILGRESILLPPVYGISQPHFAAGVVPVRDAPIPQVSVAGNQLALHLGPIFGLLQASHTYSHCYRILTKNLA